MAGSGAVCGREWGSVWHGEGECVDGSGGVCGWEWGSVWMVVGECVTGSEECEKMKGFQMHLFPHCVHTPVFFFIMCSKVVYILLFRIVVTSSA